MDSYILGSGIMDHPYVWVFFLLISVGCLFGVLSVRELERHPDNHHLFIIYTTVCIFSLFCAFFFLIDGAHHRSDGSPTIEKMEYEHHEYLIYDGHEMLHNPNCPCRKFFMNKDNKEK